MSRCPKISIPVGSDVAIVEVTGKIKNQEPGTVRVIFPGGEVEVSRVTVEGKVDYWVHLVVNNPRSHGWRRRGHRASQGVRWSHRSVAQTRIGSGRG